MLSMDSCTDNSKGQFKATKLWRDLVMHLQKNVTLKRRRNMMKSYDNSFTGTNAVDVLLEYVKHNNDDFRNNATLTRDNIVKLCQSFLENQVFESVMNTSHDSLKDMKFEDSSRCLYQFTNKGFNIASNVPSTPTTQKLSDSLDLLDPLREKFSSFALKSPRAIRSRFSMTPSKNKENNKYKNKSDSLTSDSENNFPASKRKNSVKKMSRKNSLAGFVLKRSSSDSNLRKPSTTSSDSDASNSHSHEGFSRGRLRLSHRLSFRRNHLRRSGQSSSNVQSYVIQNPQVRDHLSSNGSSDESRKSIGSSSRSNLKRRLNEIIPSDEINKIKILASKPKIRKVPNEEYKKILKECIRVRLLQLLDLSFVDSLVMSPVIPKKNCIQKEQENFVTTTIHYRELSAAYDSNDLWITKAVKLLQHITDGYSILQKLAHLDLVKKKRELYFEIRNYYQKQNKPLIHPCYGDIIQELINLLATPSTEKILEGTQLFVHLLADSCFDELRCVCSFLHEVCCQTHIRLVPKGCQKTVIFNEFAKIIIGASDQYATKTGIDGQAGLMQYLILNKQKVFTVPSTVIKNVQRKVTLLENGEINSPTLVSGLNDTHFCKTIAPSEAKIMTANHTARELEKLHHQINQSTIFSKKKKREMNKKFKSSHNEIVANIETGI